jgi:2-keto-3-deoxy-L-rhamnonate aldolase RhmA
MENAAKFREKLERGQLCYGSYITCTDATITEALCSVSDFVWIDAEHNALSLETLQAHLIATRGTDTAALVRVAWNDPVLIKPVLDIGADGVIVPLVRTVEDVRRAVAACRYPPEGVRGFGPRRASSYGKWSGPEYVKRANALVMCMVQIEHIDAVNNLEGILAVPGLTGIVLGPQDLAGSMGYMGQPEHPEVLRVMEAVIAQTRKTGVYASVSVGGGPETFAAWAKRGVQWLPMGGDLGMMMAMARQLDTQVRGLLAAQNNETGAAA